MVYLSPLRLTLCSLLFWISPISWSSPLSHFHWFGDWNIQFGGIVQNATLIPNSLEALHTKPVTDSYLTMGIYQKNQLAYISVQCKEPTIDTHYLESSRFDSLSVGAGYRTFLNPAIVLGAYCFVDFGFYDNDTTHHFNFGLDTTFHRWRGHFNGYIPLNYPYNKALKAPLPTSFQFAPNNNDLTQCYFLEKGQFSWDAKLVRERAFFNRLTPAIGIYQGYDRYMKRHILGGLLNLEFTWDTQWRTYCQLSYDKAHDYVLNLGFKWSALGRYNAQRPTYYQRLLPHHEHHLAPRFIRTEGTRKLFDQEAKDWRTYDATCKAKAADEKMRKEAYLRFRKSKKDELEAAYKFLKEHSKVSISIEGLKDIGADRRLNSWYKRNVATQLHPDSMSTKYNRKEKEEHFDKLGQHLTVLAKKGLIPPTERRSDSRQPSKS